MGPSAAFEKPLQIAKVITFFHSFQLDIVDTFAAADDGVLGSKGLDGLYSRFVSKHVQDGIVLFHRGFFRDAAPVGGEVLYPQMAPEIEDLLADGILEAVGKGQGQQHGCHADHRCRYCQPDDKTGEGPFPVKGDSTGYKSRYIQTDDVIRWSKINILILR